MTPCYAYIGTAQSGIFSWCETCGHPFWRHSHYVTKTYGHTSHVLIPREWAEQQYMSQTLGLPDGIKLPPVDLRPRYQMMMDRQPGVVAWVNVRMNQEMDRQAADLIAYTETERYQSFAGEIDEERPTYMDQPPWWAREQTEPVEVTTWHDMMKRQRQYLMPDGSIRVVKLPIQQEFGDYQPRGGHTS